MYLWKNNERGKQLKVIQKTFDKSIQKNIQRKGRSKSVFPYKNNKDIDIDNFSLKRDPS
jgi:hypothetical protein